jgi:hypothetical protein
MLKGWEAKWRVREYETKVRAVLEAPLDDRALLARLEQLAADPPLPGFVWLWGPDAYRRNRVLFRPFILSHFAQFMAFEGGHWTRVQWKGAVGDRLEAWLREVDRSEDVPLFKRLYAWKLQDTLRAEAQRRQWEADLLNRVHAATTPAARAQVLRKLDFWYALGEDAAAELYRVDADASREFILRHLPRSWTGDESRKLWTRLLDEAAGRGDETFYYRLYRRQVPLARWQKDTAELALRVRAPAQLCGELERYHPEGWGLDLGQGLYELAANRGEDVLPYVRRHLRNVWSHWHRSGFDRMLGLARSRGWWELWGALVRTCARPNEYNREVSNLVRDGSLPEDDVRHRLLLLTGASREWNAPGLSLARVQLLEDNAALALYERFPDLVRGPFRHNVAPTWGRSFGSLLRKAIQAGDEVLIDFLAARLATRGGVYSDDQLQKAAEQASHHYEALRLDELAFARRAAAVLTQIPAFSIHNYRDLIRTNRLARLLFERSSALYLTSPDALRDLIEGSEIHVQALAYRALGLDDERARALARENLDLLLATLLRPLHRATRLLALAALRNAASTPDAAARVAARARDALDLPDTHYPKDALIGLIGALLHRFPELREAGEQPVVHRRAA